MVKEDLSDDYVAGLLKAEAKKSSDRYALVGMSALMPTRPKTHAPKPNVRFLRNILRETDSHNTALLAKEAEEARERYRQIRDQERRISSGHSEKRRLKRSSEDVEQARDRRSKRSRRDSGDHESNKVHRQRRNHDSQSPRRRRRSRSRERKEDYTRQRLRDDKGDGKQSDRHSDARKTRRSKPDRSDLSRNGNMETSPDYMYTSSKSRHRSRQDRQRSSSCDTSMKNDRKASSLTRAGNTRDRSPTIASDMESDPLEEMVGPLAPKPGPPVQRRGRGAFSAAGAAVDAHFAADYDPAHDVRPPSDEEDDWEQALEVMRDRQRWKQQGADRLRQAGFTEDQVKKWEKGDEKTEDDVKWARRGEGREWDRGKLVDDEGDVTVQAEWGRLKGT